MVNGKGDRMLSVDKRLKGSVASESRGWEVQRPNHGNHIPRSGLEENLALQFFL